MHYFELEKPPGTQILRNVRDTRNVEAVDFVNDNNEKKLAFRKLAQFDPDII